LPRGWTDGAPDFIGIGVQKAGTTWWYELIASHPGVSHQGRPKELHFFDQYWNRPFEPADAPGYLSCFWVPAAMRIAAPDARLLVLLRDPVDRYRSGLTLAGANSRGGLVPVQAKEAFRRGLYAEQLEQLYQQFPRDQVLVLQYERCRKDPLPELARTFRFLDLDDSFVPPTLSEERNPAFGPRLEVPAEIRAQLVDAYTSDTKRLLELVPDLDLELWPNFRHLP
jgi:hypothetical protein